MSAVELAIEKIRALPEAKAKAVLDWLAASEPLRKSLPVEKGAVAARGFALPFQKQRLSADAWLKILREGEK